MNAILGMSELLEETKLDPEQQEYLKALSRNGEALLTLINDILDLSKIEAGKMELALESVDVALLLQNSLVVLKESALKHQIDLEPSAHERFFIEGADAGVVIDHQNPALEAVFHRAPNF